MPKSALTEVGRIDNVTFKVELGGNAQPKIDPRSAATPKNASSALWTIIKTPLRLLGSILTQGWSQSNILERILKVLLTPVLIILTILLFPLILLYYLVNSLFPKQDSAGQSPTAKMFAAASFEVLHKPRNIIESLINSEKQAAANAIRFYTAQKLSQQEILFELQTKFFLPPALLKRNKKNELFLNEELSSLLKNFIGETHWEKCLPVTEKVIAKSPLKSLVETMGLVGKSKQQQTSLIPVDAVVMSKPGTAEDAFLCRLTIIMPYSTAQEMASKMDKECRTYKLADIIEQAREEFEAGTEETVANLGEINIEDVKGPAKVSPDANRVHLPRS
ncbi:hypothetical protein RLOatenuis_0390 [Rickettsiales bacterium]|nr:hypothetical protein RLOatenuis_0390 [Rickettsiales bacterium]